MKQPHNIIIVIFHLTHVPMSHFYWNIYIFVIYINYTWATHFLIWFLNKNVYYYFKFAINYLWILNSCLAENVVRRMCRRPDCRQPVRTRAILYGRGRYADDEPVSANHQRGCDTSHLVCVPSGRLLSASAAVHPSVCAVPWRSEIAASDHMAVYPVLVSQCAD